MLCAVCCVMSCVVWPKQAELQVIFNNSPSSRSSSSSGVYLFLGYFGKYISMVEPHIRLRLPLRMKALLVRGGKGAGGRFL